MSIAVSQTQPVSLTLPPQVCTELRCLCRGEIRITTHNLFDTRFGLEEIYDVGICQECGLEVTCPPGGPENLEELYEKHYNFGGESGTRYTRLREMVLASTLYRLWLKLDGDISFYCHQGHGRLLDVGCNEGRALHHFQRNGWNAEGLELNRNAAGVARSRGFVVHTESLAELEPGYKYDVIVMSNVLEHVRNPQEVLMDVQRLLSPKGQLWISCPNNRSLLRSIFGRYWINWHVPFHLTHFSSKTLHRMLSENGFEITKSKQRSPSLWLAHSVIARMFARRGYPTKQLRNPWLIAVMLPLARLLCFPILFAANCTDRGDCLVTIAQKS